MPKTKLQKQEILRTLEKKIKKAKSIVFTEFNSLGVKGNEELRNNLREADSEYMVAKKTLLDIAFKEEKIENLDIKSFEGKIAAVFGYKDEVAPAKIVDEFQNKNEENKEKVRLVAGILENKFLNMTEVTALAKLPSKDELYAKIVGSLNAPISGFVNVLAGNIRGLVNVLKAIEEKKA
ncbi:50S ribosomal protein L10 [Candidatus Parcubacteria bacterium]|nr:50S ribosomal protein L10 [Candidatus Parcubacteria bacterium]